MNNFTHLHLHTEYSLLDGMCRIKPLIERAKKLGMTSIACTEHGNMFSAIEFYHACKTNNINPIIGSEFYVANRSRFQKENKIQDSSNHLILLAKNEIGYKNLLKLSTLASTEGFYYKPRIDKDLISQYSDGIICLSACLGGKVPHLIMAGNYKLALDTAAEYREIFGDNYYLELQNHLLTDQQMININLKKIGNELNIPTVATNDVHYINREDAKSHQILLCIQTKTTLDDPKKMSYGSNEFYFKSYEEMARVFPKDIDSVERTNEIASQCNIEIQMGRLGMPSPGDIPHGITTQEYLTELAFKGAHKLYKDFTAEHEERLRYELDIIDKTGFAMYFLLVRDIAKYASDNGIYLGIRGSAAGSMVCYCVEITRLDPILYGLTFERFLNPERISMPDIDIDIEDARRQEVINYVTEKYGKDCVAQIVTFGTLGAKAAMKDCGRVMGKMNLSEIEKLTKLIDTKPGTTITSTLQNNPEFREAYDTDDNSKELIDTALSVEGLTRHSSVHAAGVIIASDPLWENVPLQKIDDKGSCCTQYPAKYLEEIGLLKMDFLGLANLAILSKTVNNIKETKNIDVDVWDIPLDDKKTYELLGNGECTGIFQLESPQMRRYVSELKPDTVGDIAAMVALYRPGPMEHIPRFINCKHGREEIQYIHPALEDVIKDTYGVIVYQDQIMKIVQAIANFTLGHADILRKAIGKKNKELLMAQKQDFIEGAVKNGVLNSNAEEIFNVIEPFAGYSFNKCVSGDTLVYEIAMGRFMTVNEMFYSTDRQLFTHSLNIQSNSLVVNKILSVMKNGVKSVFLLKTFKGNNIKATGNHPLWTNKGWVKIEDLKIGDFVVTSKVKNKNYLDDLDWDTVVSITPKGEEMTYDLEIENDHNFIANGIIVHNSHAACYAMVAYQTAYLKTNYPVEFFAAIMETKYDNTDQLMVFIEDAKRQGINVSAPDVNLGESSFKIEDKSIRFGLSAIKGLGDIPITAIEKAKKEDGYFKSLYDFCLKTQKYGLSKTSVLSLIRCGALKSIEPEIGRLVAGLSSCWDSVTKVAKDNKIGQMSIFDCFDEECGSPELPVTFTPLPQKTILEFEKELLGFYLTQHPIDEYLKEFGSFMTHTCSEARNVKDGDKIRIAGILSEVKPYYTKTKNELMYFMTLEDKTGSIKITMFPRDAVVYGGSCTKGRIVGVDGKASYRDRNNSDSSGVSAEILASKIVGLKLKNSDNVVE